MLKSSPLRLNPIFVGMIFFSGVVLSTGCDSSRDVHTTNSNTPTTLPLNNEPTDAPTPNPPVTPPTGEVRVVPYTRLICQPPSLGPISTLSTILTQAGPSGLPATLSMQEADGKPIDMIERLEMISGNEHSFNFVFSEVHKDRQQLELYLGKMDLLYKKAQFTKLSTAPLIPNASGRIFDREGNAGYMAFSRMSESLLVPDMAADRYIIRDSFSPHVLSNVFLSPKEYINPALSADADIALFQKIEKGNLRNYAYSLDSGEAVPFPTSADTLNQTVTQYAPHIYRSGNIVWLERTKTGLVLKLTDWASLKRRSVVTLTSISEENLVTLDFGVRQGYLYLAQVFESYRTQDLDRYIQNGKIELTEWNLSALSEKKNSTLDYPKSFYDRRLVANQQGIERILFSPWNNQWVLTTPRGLAVIHLKNLEWEFVGVQNGYLQCKNPNIGPEYHVEEVRP